MSERERLEALCARDGVEAAKLWARRAANLYRVSIGNPTHYASQSDWKPLLDQSIRELEVFSETGVIP